MKALKKILLTGLFMHVAVAFGFDFKTDWNAQWIGLNE